jgi:hypothetical protein
MVGILVLSMLGNPADIFIALIRGTSELVLICSRKDQNVGGWITLRWILER